MIDRVKSISLYVLVGLVVQWGSMKLRSNFLEVFLGGNLVTLLLALLAINTTTMSIIMTKLRDISGGNHGNFGRTINAMRESIIEQVGLIVCAIVILILKTSASLQSQALIFLANTVLIAIFIYAIQILYDTANGVFVILHYEDQGEQSKSKRSNGT